MTASPVSWLRERAVEFERLGAPLYAVLVRGIARDWETGGPVRDVLAGWEEAPSEAVVDLRLLGGLFRIVLRGRAPALAPFYRSLGGRAGPEGAWDVAREVVAALRTPRFDVFVPRSNGPLIQLTSPLPRRAREAIGRWLKADQSLLKADRSAREDYEARAAASAPAADQERSAV